MNLVLGNAKDAPERQEHRLVETPAEIELDDGRMLPAGIGRHDRRVLAERGSLRGRV